jgi:hypothetical protein
MVPEGISLSQAVTLKMALNTDSCDYSGMKISQIDILDESHLQFIFKALSKQDNTLKLSNNLLCSLEGI